MLKLAFVVLASNLPAVAADEKIKISVNRKTHLLKVERLGKVLVQSKVGLGRGGQGQKKSMNDCITPEGEFEVDIILSENSALDKVSESLLAKYKSNKMAESYLSSQDGLAKLFVNMNSIDFNGDDKADTAYGAAYIGLNSDKAITGPKLSQYNGITYWFSIALHGTADESKNIARSNSGGCVQVPRSVLNEMLEKGIIKIGTKILID